jgi:predicted NAD/FAD-dependent oxidoreductase
MSAFPKSLARGLKVELQTNVIGVEGTSQGVRVIVNQGSETTSFEAADLVLAVAGPEALGLLEQPLFAKLGATSRALLEIVPSVPCATVLALYDFGYASKPDWDVCYPEASQKLLLVSHDSAKRVAPKRLALVFQARPAWSATVAVRRSDDWAPELLEEAAPLLGAWVRAPAIFQAHLWRYARTTPDAELRSPLLFRLANGATVGISGECCATGGGIQAAWHSGRELATKLCEKERI